MIQSLDVIIWGKKVGTLVSAKKGYKNQICFYFDPEFVKHGPDIAPSRAPLSSPAIQAGMPVYPEEDKIFSGLPSFIADSMPDHWGNTVFNEWARVHKIRKKELSALDRLAYIGRRGMGALEFIPPVAESMEIPFKVEIGQLSELAQAALREAKDFQATLSPNLAIESLFKVGTSAGGRRPKAVINLNPATGECYSGQVAAPSEDFIPMIIKFDERSDVPSTKIEYSYYLMAKDANMDMKPSRLMECEKASHFLTERFDREGAEKIHVQSLAAMNPYSSSYEDLIQTAKRIGISNDEIRNLYRQMVMNICAANIDDHNKNFSFILRQGGEWHISPAYDFTFTVDPSAPFYMNRHSLTVNEKREDITRDDLLEIARLFDIKAPDTVIDEVATTVANYRQYADKAHVPSGWVKKIGEEIAHRLDLIASKA